MPISDIVATVTHLRCRQDGAPAGTGSGFFYEQDDQLFLITNRHVVIDERACHHPDEVVLRLHTTPDDIRQSADLAVPLYRQSSPLWQEHPAGPDVDVVAIPLAREDIARRFFIRAFGKATHIPDDVDIAIGEDVQVIGYPLGFHDELHNLPIIRNATIASVYPVPFRGHPFVLIDARLHSGTSGSPALTKPTNILRKSDGSIAMLGGSVTYLLGVHSASLDIVDRDPDRDEPLGLNIVWYASLIQEIIDA